MPNAIEKRMHDKGYGVLGSGYFATVWEDRHDRVGKWVVKTGPTDDGWLDYAIVAMDPQWATNPFVPKIRFLRINEDDGFYVAVIERLDSTVSEALASLQDPMYVRYVDIREYLCAGNGQHKLDPLCVAFVDRLREAFEGTRFDLHSGNVMLRGDQLVITDPVGLSPAGPQYDNRSTARRRFDSRSTPRRSRLSVIDSLVF